MSEGPKDPKNDPQQKPPAEQLADLKTTDEELSPKERFEKTSHIGLLMAYDLIDKLRYWEKETLKLPDEEVPVRLEHLVKSVDRLRDAYLTFADLDF
jgi:hypothetical protein